MKHYKLRIHSGTREWFLQQVLHYFPTAVFIQIKPNQTPANHSNKFFQGVRKRK